MRLKIRPMGKPKPLLLAAACSINELLVELDAAQASLVASHLTRARYDD